MLLLARLRGLATSMAIWASLTAALGAAYGLAYSFGLMPAHIRLEAGDFPGGVPAVLAVWGARVGARTGAIFAVSMMIAERRVSLSTLRGVRVGLWASFSSAAAGLLVFGPMPGIEPALAVFGFVFGFLTLRIAQRETDSRLLR
jgi:hypothetical protein